MHGQFIVLEGPDGSGTTTHCAALAQRLQTQHFDVTLTNEPTSGPIGLFIRQMLASKQVPSDALQLLFTADRAWHIQNVLEPAILSGHTVVCDRYWLSTAVYAQALGLDPEPYINMNKNFIQPNVQIVLLPPLEVCLERLGRRDQRDILEGDSLQRRVYAGYVDIAQQMNLTIIDTSGDEEDVSDAIAAVIAA